VDLAEQIARAAGGAEIARWAALTSGDKFAFQPAAHLRPTMIVPVWHEGAIVEDEVIGVEQLEYSGPVYDLDVAQLRNYIVDGVVVHNSIYGWRQADIQNILNFERDYPEAQVILLEQNYRSTQVILDTAQHVIAPNTERKEKRLWTENAGGLPVTIYEAYNEDDEASYTAREISRLVKTGKARWRDCAVMYRMNAQSRAIEQAFLGYNVPYQVVGGVRFYSRKEIKDVLALLRLTLNPFDSVSLIRAVNNTPVGRGIGAKTLADLERAAGLRGVPLYAELQLLINGEEEDATLSRQTANKLHPLLEMIDSFIAMRDQVNLLELLDRILERTRYGEFLKDGTDEGDERWNNVLEIRSVAGNYNELTPPEGLSRFLEDVALISDIDTIQEEKDAVTLITLHAAKGLEFPVVVMIGLEEGLLPHNRALDSLHELEEERRLAYVGITRAKQHLYLIYAFKRTFYGETRISTPSRFIHDIPPHLAKGLERAKATSRMTAGQGPGGRGQGAGSGGARYSSDSEPTGRVFGASGRSGTGSGSSSYREPPTRPPQPPARTPPRPTNPPPPTPNPQPGFRAGDKVRHAIFGEGIVVMTTATGGDEEVTVAFAGQGVKRLLASMAHLERL
jgi:DNA helicase-2/ATP-dependent DNA helicase PcrA